MVDEHLEPEPESIEPLPDVATDESPAEHAGDGQGGGVGFGLIIGAVFVLVAAGVYVLGAAGRADDETAAAEASAEEAIAQFDPDEFASEFTPEDLATSTTVPESLPLEDEPSTTTTLDPDREAELAAEAALVNPMGDAFDPVTTAMVFVNRTPGDDYGKLGWIDFEGERRQGGLECSRVDWNFFGGICLVDGSGLAPTPAGYITDNRLEPTTRFGLNKPSRAAISPDGSVVAWTGFTLGHSYLNPGEFATLTQLIEVERTIGANLETVFDTFKDDELFAPVDRNYWGVTFVDNDRFYATMATDGVPSIVQGSIDDVRIDVRFEGYSCPEVSPDGRTIVAKEMVEGGFRLVAIDVATGASSPLGETRLVDDQVEWLDADTIVYAIANPDEGTDAQPVFDIWAVDVTPGAQPRLLVPFADSPAVP